jgi:hypothetical protein
LNRPAEEDVSARCNLARFVEDVGASESHGQLGAAVQPPLLSRIRCDLTVVVEGNKEPASP